MLALVVLAWGAGPPLTKLVTAEPLVGAMIRFGISFPVLFAIVHFTGRELSLELFRRTLLPGASFGVNLILVFAALQEVTVAVLAVTIAIQPVLLLLIGGPLFGERPSWKQVAWTPVGVVGAAIVVLGAGSDLRASPLGIGLSLAAMSTFTVYFVLTRVARSNTAVDPIEWMAGINFWAFAVTVPPSIVLLDRSDFGEFGGLDWLWITLIAYVTGVFGHVAMSWVHGYIEAARSSLYLLAMNVVAVGLAWPIHDEPVTAVQAGGAALVVVAVAAVIRLPTADRT